MATLRQIGTCGFGGLIADNGSNRIICRYITAKASAGYLHGLADYEEVILAKVRKDISERRTAWLVDREIRISAKIDILREFARELEAIPHAAELWKEFYELELDIKWRLAEGMFYLTDK